MIAPKIMGEAALLARFAAIPVALRTALAGEADRLGRVLRDETARRSAGGPVSFAVLHTNDGVTLTLTRRPARARPQAGVVAEPAAFAAMGPQIRAGLETAFRRVLVR